MDASHANYVPAGAQITVGSRVEVEGTWLSGVLIAVKVDVENAQTLNTVEIEAVIDQFTSVADFVVRGQRCDATSASISHGTRRLIFTRMSKSSSRAPRPATC